MKSVFLLFIVTALYLQVFAQGNFGVSTVSPPSQSMNFLPTLEITINFNSEVDLTSFNDTTFQVWGRWSGVHKGTLSFIQQ